jgi:hypothetical protein
MARRGSLPWLLLAAIICTLFAVFLESAFIHPTTDALMGTETWQTNHNEYSWAGKRMIGQFAAHVLTVIALGIWINVLIEARRSV